MSRYGASCRRCLVAAAVTATIGIIASQSTVRVAAATVAQGDVVVSIGDGKAVEVTRTGTVVQTFDDGSGTGFTTGSVFDSSGNFYLTDWNANGVHKFDPAGNLAGPFGSGYANPESILQDASGHFFVGNAAKHTGSAEILELDASGNVLATFHAATESAGNDWIDLAADQKTIYYTSEGKAIKRFDVSTGTQLPDFATGLPAGQAYALRLLPDGGVIVADTDRVLHLDSTGAIVKTYTFADVTGLLFAVNLDPDGTSFWTAEEITSPHGSPSHIINVDIASGAVLHDFTVTPASDSDVAGLTVKGEVTVGGPAPTIAESPAAFLLIPAGGLALAAAMIVRRRRAHSSLISAETVRR